MDAGKYSDIELIVVGRVKLFKNRITLGDNKEEIPASSILGKFLESLVTIPYALYFTNKFDADLLELLNKEIDVLIEFFNDIALNLKLHGINIDDVADDIEKSIYDINKDNILSIDHRKLTSCDTELDNTHDENRTLKIIAMLLKLNYRALNVALSK